MDISLILTGAITLLRPALEKAATATADNLAEKLGDGTVQSMLWPSLTPEVT